MLLLSVGGTALLTAPSAIATATAHVYVVVAVVCSVDEQQRTGCQIASTVLDTVARQIAHIAHSQPWLHANFCFTP